MKNLPIDSMDILLASLSSESKKQYESAWKKWWKFCNEENIDLYNGSITEVISCLTKEFKSGAKHGSFNTLRSAISLIVGPHISSDLHVKRFFKGVTKLRPSLPKYNYTWDPKIVLDFFSGLQSNENLSLKELAMKTITLLALITGQRLQTLSLIKLVNIDTSGS